MFKRIKTQLIVVLLASPLTAAEYVTVKLSTATITPVELKEEFFSVVDDKFNATAPTKATPTSSVYSMTIYSTKVSTQTLPTEEPVQNCTAMNECTAIGYAWGVDDERKATLDLIHSYQVSITTFTADDLLEKLYTEIDQQNLEAPRQQELGGRSR